MGQPPKFSTENEDQRVYVLLGLILSFNFFQILPISWSKVILCYMYVYIMVKAPAGNQGIVILLVVNEGLGFLKLANIMLILINPCPCYVKYRISLNSILL